MKQNEKQTPQTHDRDRDKDHRQWLMGEWGSGGGGAHSRVPSSVSAWPVISQTSNVCRGAAWVIPAERGERPGLRRASDSLLRCSHHLPVEENWRLTHARTHAGVEEKKEKLTFFFYSIPIIVFEYLPENFFFALAFQKVCIRGAQMKICCSLFKWY